ncbi:hypothetical protein D051_4352 [Vibrio parahaemolyticus VPCR-2010]|nr:hypothetical protein D051_4352 [Vibrio parahaemolyticus VPCR-2010]
MPSLLPNKTNRCPAAVCFYLTLAHSFIATDEIKMTFLLNFHTSYT